MISSRQQGNFPLVSRPQPVNGMMPRSRISQFGKARFLRTKPASEVVWRSGVPATRAQELSTFIVDNFELHAARVLTDDSEPSLLPSDPLTVSDFLMLGMKPCMRVRKSWANEIRITHLPEELVCFACPPIFFRARKRQRWT
jgi:hypothetical protein